MPNDVKKKMSENVEIKDKICITVQEAVAYSGLPISKIKELLKDPECSFRLYPPKKGMPVLIKRKAFEEYILSDDFGKDADDSKEGSKEEK